MIIGTGVDIAEVPRIRETIERFGERFLRRIFTEGEIRYCERKARRFESYAARFAAKEDYSISWRGGGHRGQAWHEKHRALDYAHFRGSPGPRHSGKLIRADECVRRYVDRGGNLKLLIQNKFVVPSQQAQRFRVYMDVT